MTNNEKRYFGVQGQLGMTNRDESALMIKGEKL